jgi:cytochrome c oxidase cbb3-type subunit 3
VNRQTNAVLDHSYDGIQEYDNPTPGWWWLLFYATVAFSVVYFVFFQFSPLAWTRAQELDSAVASNLRLQFGEIGDLQPDEATLLRFMSQPKWLLVGKTVFAGKCVSCHGSDASGVVGPNLTDDYWKNVKRVEDIAGVIANGAANGAMPSWKHQLHPNEIVLTAAYIASLRGQNLPSSRGVEGERIAPWPEQAAAPADAPANGNGGK